MQILVADGWAIRKIQLGRAMLVKDGHQSIHLTTPLIHPVKRVKAICENAKISAEQFDELFLRTAAPSAPGLADSPNRQIH